MNIEMTKELDKANLVTHAGTFHADEVFSTIILSKIIDKITLIRVSEALNSYEGKIVYDIGGGIYDHHQLGGNGKREDGVKYAACGLIWKAYGKDALLKMDKSLNEADLDYVWKMIDEDLIEFIDSNDNGQLETPSTTFKYVHISKIIGSFNPFWNEDIDQDDEFYEALKLADIIFDRVVKSNIAKYKAKSIVDEAIENSEDGVMELSKCVPWKEFVLNSKNEKAKSINFIVYPSTRGGYSIYAVPIAINSFSNRKNFPEAWGGLRNEELAKVTNVKTATFCHNARFICSAKTREDALKLARLAENE